jgi:UDP-N-acetylmuramate dehydrogenase
VPTAKISSLIQTQVALANLTSFRVGGQAEYFIAPRQLDQLQAAVEWAKSQQLPITMIGAGSNLLISDRGLPGLVICTRHLRQVHCDEATVRLTAVAGEPIVKLAWQAAERGWSGLEWAVGIPGTVGGSVVMNAGAQGGCVADILIEAQILDSQGNLVTLQNAQLDYGYRSSILQRSDCQDSLIHKPAQPGEELESSAGREQVKPVCNNGDGDRPWTPWMQPCVLQATFQLDAGYDPAEITATTRKYLEHRHSTQPYHLPSCGSVFRNPLPYTAGWLIEQTGLKGFQIGGAQVSTLHANFIVNRGGATASDILALIRHIQQQVEQRWAIYLHPEVKQLGEFSEQI